MASGLGSCAEHEKLRTRPKWGGRSRKGGGGGGKGGGRGEGGNGGAGWIEVKLPGEGETGKKGEAGGWERHLMVEVEEERAPMSSVAVAQRYSCPLPMLDAIVHWKNCLISHGPSCHPTSALSCLVPPNTPAISLTCCLWLPAGGRAGNRPFKGGCDGRMEEGG